MEMYFVPECYFDTVLVKSILQVKKVNHQHGCDTVIKKMTIGKGLDDGFAVGIIDNDKKVLKYISQECIEEVRTESLVLLRHRTKKHFIIQLVPAVEQWVLNIIEEGSIDVSDLNLPTDLLELRRYTKYKFVSEDEDLKRLCKRLVSSNSNSMRILKLWLGYLYENHRNTKIEDMRSLINISAKELK